MSKRLDRISLNASATVGHFYAIVYSNGELAHVPQTTFFDIQNKTEFLFNY